MEIEQPAQPRPSPHAARHVGLRRAGTESIVEPLVIPFTMICWTNSATARRKWCSPMGESGARLWRMKN